MEVGLLLGYSNSDREVRCLESAVVNNLASSQALFRNKRHCLRMYQHQGRDIYIPLTCTTAHRAEGGGEAGALSLHCQQQDEIKSQGRVNNEDE